MTNELIGYAELTINGMGYALYAVSKDHDAKCISISKVSEIEDESLPFFGKYLPAYEEKAEASLWDEINSQKAKPKESQKRLYAPAPRKPLLRTGMTSANFRADLFMDEPTRSPSERKAGKIMSQKEIKQLLAEAFGMEDDE